MIYVKSKLGFECGHTKTKNQEVSVLRVRLKHKILKLQTCRIFQSRGPDGREVICAPIIGKDGKVHRFIILDKSDPLPIPRQESEICLRVD